IAPGRAARSIDVRPAGGSRVTAPWPRRCADSDTVTVSGTDSDTRKPHRVRGGLGPSSLSSMIKGFQARPESSGFEDVGRISQLIDPTDEERNLLYGRVLDPRPKRLREALTEDHGEGSAKKSLRFGGLLLAYGECILRRCDDGIGFTKGTVTC